MRAIDRLSDRETEILDLQSRGLMEKEIAAKLFLSNHTIHAHVRNIRKKLNAKCTVDAVRTYILSIDEPRKYFSSIGLLAVQVFIIANVFTTEIRRTPKNYTCRFNRICLKIRSNNC